MRACCPVSHGVASRCMGPRSSTDASVPLRASASQRSSAPQRGAPVPSRATVPPRTSGPLRILVVDDDRSIHDGIRQALAESPRKSSALVDLEALLFDDSPEPEVEQDDLPAYEIHSAYQGQEAATRLGDDLEHGLRFDLVIMDMRMPPGWDGVKTVEELWKHDESLPVVFCTAYSDYRVEQIAERLKQRQVPVLSKPFHTQQLKELVRRHARNVQ
jgi:CheY-like chemotaxis protein